MFKLLFTKLAILSLLLVSVSSYLYGGGLLGEKHDVLLTAGGSVPVGGFGDTGGDFGDNDSGLATFGFNLGANYLYTFDRLFSVGGAIGFIWNGTATEIEELAGEVDNASSYLNIPITVTIGKFFNVAENVDIFGLLHGGVSIVSLTGEQSISGVSETANLTYSGIAPVIKVDVGVSFHNILIGIGYFTSLGEAVLTGESTSEDNNTIGDTDSSQSISTFNFYIGYRI